MLPRLQAEERLASINDGAIASGAADRGAQRDTIRTLERLAGRRRARRNKPGAMILGAMGIGIRDASAASQQALSDG